ncbi:proton-conducting transporter membrane subunit [Streptomyces aidingensis]|uniref:proton-conducting transporter transmembrane domain-containing protein n=1 Tax=Streptomyces aidingensis TaxID=910347 RepID=UPI000B8162E4|nr:proton-conducting transporter membrane subunit [Streptomyces aidingensis]
MTVLLWLLPALPLTAGALLASAGRRAARIAPGAAVAVSVAALGLAVAVAAAGAAGRPETADAPLFAGVRAGLRVDGLSAVMVVVVTAVTLAVLVWSLARPPGRTAADHARFPGLMLLFAGAMLVTVTADTLPPLLMAWEVMGATSWALIGFDWREPEKTDAAGTAFLTTRAADLGLYAAAGAALAGGADTLALDALPEADGGWLDLLTAGVVLAALGKSAQLPFSFWLSRAMRGPSPVSALLHSAAMVAAGAYLLLRLRPVLDASGWGAPLVAWAGAVTALALGAVAVAQTELKQVLAASTCAQLGFAVLAAGAGSTAGGAAQLAAHAAVKAALFLAAGAWLAALGTERLAGLRGAARARPALGAAAVAAALTLAGLPPLSLWAAKDQVLAAARHESAALYAAGLAAAALAAGYATTVLRHVLAPAPAAGPETPGGRGGAAGRPGAGTGTERERPVPGAGSGGSARHREVAGTPAEGERPVPGAGSGGAGPAGRAPAQGVGGGGAAAGGPGPGTAARVVWPVGVLALAGVVLGVVALPSAARWLRENVGAVGEPVPVPWEAVLSAAVAVAAAAFAWWRPGPPRLPRAVTRPVRRWIWPASAVHPAVVRPVLSAARALAAFDDRVVDGAVRGLARAGPGLARALAAFDDRAVDGAVRAAARGGRAAGRLAARADDGGPDAAVRALAAGARALGRAARRPQTGLLHHYYAQAVTGFAVLALFLLLLLLVR